MTLLEIVVASVCFGVLFMFCVYRYICYKIDKDLRSEDGSDNEKD